MTNSNAETQSSANPADKLFYWRPFLWLAGIVALTIGIAFVPIPSPIAQLSGSLVLTVVYVGLILGFVVAATRYDNWKVLLIGGVISAVCWGILRVMPWDFLPSFVIRNALADATLTASAVFLGALVGKFLIRTPNMLGPICVIIAMIDIWGVLFGGIVAQLLAKAPDVASQAMTQGPAAGAASASSRFIIRLPSVGIGDYLFLGILFAALAVHHLNVRAAWRWVWPLMAAALLAVMFGITALPGLLFIGLGVALPNLKSFRYSREEKFALLYALIFVIILTAGLYFFFTRVLLGA